LPQNSIELSVPVFGLDGVKGKTLKLPRVFSERLEPELIARAVLAIQTSKKQAQGTKPRAGRENTAEYRGMRGLPQGQRGINVGHARLPRLKNRTMILSGRVAGIPRAVGGPKAHPPKAEKKFVEKINKKEKRKALKSAVASSANKELVSNRHRIADSVIVPIVVVDKFEDISKTRDVLAFFEAIGIKTDTDNAKDKTKRKSGKGKRRGRTKKKKKSVLIVTGKNSAVYRAARNLIGVDIVPVNEVNADLFAPGGLPGRLTVFTESAIAWMEKW